MKRFFSLLLITATASTGCVATPSGPGDEDPSPGTARAALTSSSRGLSSYSGEELYAGILYGDGPAADLVASVASYIDATARVSAEHHRQIQSLVDEVRAKNPGFFEGFAADIRSGDRVAIREALDRACKVTAAAVRQLHAAEIEARTRNGRAATGDPTLSRGTWFFVEGYVAVAVVILVVISAIDTTPVVGSPDSGLILDGVSDDLAALSGT